MSSLSTLVDYIGGLHYIPECESLEARDQLLHYGFLPLSRWFILVKAWTKDLEDTRHGKLCWLIIEGVPLQKWNENIFCKIAELWGDVVEVEDLTTQHLQTHIGRVCIQAANLNFINEMVILEMEGTGF